MTPNNTVSSCCQVARLSRAVKVFEPVQGEGRDGVKSFMEQKRLIQISDMSVIEKIVDDVLMQNQQQLQQYCAGKTKLQGFFVGQAPTPTAICISPSSGFETLCKTGLYRHLADVV